MSNVRVCTIDVTRMYCEDKQIKCRNCEHKDTCDGYWITTMWEDHDKRHKGKGLLSQPITGEIKNNIREHHIITYGSDNDNFCMYNASASKQRVTIYDLYVSASARGKGYARKIIEWLQTTYDCDVFVKCARDSESEKFWQHIGEQLDANDGKGEDFYEHRPNRRDMGWYIIRNNNQRKRKVDLW